MPMLGTPYETTAHMWQESEDYKSTIMNSRWGSHFEELSKLYADKPIEKHNIAQDNLPGEINFLNTIVPDRNPMLIGPDTLNLINVTEPTTRFPVLESGVSAKTARGLTNNLSRTGRIHYNNLTLQDSWNTNDSVDQDFLEDLQTGMIQYYWNELYRTHREQISKIYLDFVCAAHTAGNNKTDPSGNTYKIESWQVGTNAATLDGLIATWAKAKENNIMPDTLVCNFDVYAKFLQDEERLQEQRLPAKQYRLSKW